MAENLNDDSNRNFQFSVNGENVSKLSAEQVQELMGTINNSLKDALNIVNESLTNMLSGININGLQNDESKIDLTQVMKSLPISNSLMKMSRSNLNELLPELETSENNGKFKVLLNKKKLFEFDLTSLKSEE